MAHGRGSHQNLIVGHRVRWRVAEHREKGDGIKFWGLPRAERLGKVCGDDRDGGKAREIDGEVALAVEKPN